MNLSFLKRPSKAQRFFLSFLLVFLLISSIGLTSTEAISDIKVVINGQALSTDVAPVMIQGRTMVPLRAIFEGLGADVKWDGDTGKITGIKDSTVIVLYIGNNLAIVNGEPVKLDVPATLIGGRIMVPARFIAESLGADVVWDGNTRTVNISTVLAPITVTPTPTKLLTAREVIELIEPTTVLIETHRSQGSGFFISRDGQVATNAHVVRGGSFINVTTFDGRKYSADIIKIDNARDLAILRVNAYATFPYISQYRYKANVSRGDDVLAFGSPLGLTKTVTRGIVSARREWSPSEAWIPPIEIIQHDATIAPGSSGGPVVNLYGELIGVNFASFLLKDINFAIPTDFLIILLNSPERYEEREDWYSFYTENWEWDKEYKEINEIFNKAMITTNIRYALSLLEEGVSRGVNLWEKIGLYEPRYNRIKELRDAKREMIFSQTTYYGLIKENYSNPFFPPFSQDTLSRVYNVYVDSFNTYYKMYNALFNQYFN